jgi:hypothetical protein
MARGASATSRAAGAGVAAGASPEGHSHGSDGTNEESRCPRVELTDEAGRFAIPGLEQRAYQVGVQFREAFDLAPGEERDLGTIQTRPGGRLTVRVVRPPELLENSIQVWAEDDYRGR